jgi:hypothetical protein
MTSHDEVRASDPRVPEPSRALVRARAEQAARSKERAEVERRSVTRGLLLLAIVVSIASIARAGYDRVLFQGWWRHW